MGCQRGDVSLVPAQQTGWFYKVSAAGTVGGVSFSVGDDIYAIANNASTATYAGNWAKMEGGITLSEIVAALGFTPLSVANNLSDLASAPTALTNLGFSAKNACRPRRTAGVWRGGRNGRAAVEIRPGRLADGT